MEKLYKRVNGTLHYHEAWDNGKKIIEHWGVVGEKGKTREHPLTAGADPEDAISTVLEAALEKGFEPIADEDHAVLIIEFNVKGFGTKDQLPQRHALQERMDETLGWTGLGHCDGGSSGSGTMEVCCLVVDFDIAKTVIEKDLEGTPFRAYSRIYNEGE